VFRFTLPAVPDSAPDAPAPGLPGSRRDNTPTVLLCDDDPVTREVLGMLLREHGYAATAVGRGRDAVDRAAAEHPDVILLDLRMPGMTGWEAIRELKARPQTSGIPIVVMSALTPAADPDLAARTEGWLTKPVDSDRMDQVLAAALNGARDRPTALIVEDDDDLAAVLVAIFAQRGVRAVRAATQQEAIAQLAQLRPDVLVLDLHLDKIAGSAGTFGYARASEIARELESILAAGRTDRDAAMLAGDLVKDLDAALRETAPVPPGGTVTAVGSAPVVLLVCPSAALAHAIAANARTRGLNPEIARDIPAAQAALRAGRRPAAAVIHLPDALDDLLGELDRLGTAVVGLLPPNAGTASRAAALRAGARLLLDAPLDPVAGAAQITDAIAALLDDRDHSVPRVLAVDDDETVLQAVRHLLGSTSVQIETLSEPEAFWATLRQFQPDLLLLDVDMPGVSGLELCRLVRSDPRWSQLSVVFLSSSHDPDAVGRVYAAGADDFVSKPVAGPELQARIANRLERARLHRLLAETDPLTGLANRRRLERDLNRLQLLADRYHCDLSLAVMDVDHFKRVNDRYGHACGDEVLRRLAGHLQAAFRGEDAVARVGGEEFVVAMLGMRREDAVERLSSVLLSFRDTPQEIGGELVTVAASGGVAQHGRDGVGFAALYRAADGALRVASERPRPGPAGGGPANS
jgi:diguanylate cyclase (GGDEF)-like protein